MPIRNEETLLSYPTDFPIKVMGRKEKRFAATVLGIVRRHAPDFDAATMELRPSRQGTYLSVTCTIRATSRPAFFARPVTAFRSAAPSVSRPGPSTVGRVL